MLYVAFLTFRPGLTQEQQQAALARRAGYKFPDGHKQVAEFWLSGAPQVVVVFEADSYAPIFQLELNWQDLFDIVVHPATTADEGLKIGAQLMQQAG